MATTTPNFGWSVPTSTDLVKDGATAIETLGDAIDASLVDLKGGTTGQVLAKNSNTDMDFTWAAPTSGDITGVTAGTGITGGGTSGDVTVSFDQANFGGGQFAAGKNKIINGDFSINQRAFTSTTTNGAFGFDRWLIGSVNGTTTYTTQAFTAGTAPVSGYEGTNFARLATTGQGVNSLGVLIQRIESARTFAGQTVAVSFWAKASSGTPQIATNFLRSYGTGGSPSTDEYTNTGVKTTLSTSWARYTVTLAVPSVSGKTFGTTANTSFLALYLFVSDSLTPGSNSLGAQNVTIDFWGVQAEAGSIATPFQTASGSIAGELAACQRYYWRSVGGSTNSTFGAGYAWSTTQTAFPIKYPVTMRIEPTSFDYSNLSVGLYGSGPITVTSASLDSGNSGPDWGMVTATVASGLTTNRPYDLCTNTTTGYIGMSAEL